MPRYRPPPPPPVPVRLGGVVRYDRMPPRGLRRYLWKQGVSVDAHLGFAMLEWWEALIVALIILPITVLFWYSAYNYFPGHIEYLSKRFAYYVFGDENVDILACTRAYVAEWINLLWLWVRSVTHGGSPVPNRMDL